MRTLTIGRDDAGQRLDRFLRKYLESATLGHVFKLLRTGRVRVNGRRARPELRLQDGDRVEVHVAEEELGGLTRRRRGRRSAPVDRSRAALRVLHRDAHVLAVDKPPMLLVQPGDAPREPSLDRLVLDLVGEGDALTFRPSLAHRLDRGTSGIVLFGLSAQGLRGLTEAFRRRRVTKRYLALVAGAPEQDRFTVDLPLERDDRDERRGKKVRVSHGPGGRPAQTEVEVLSRSAGGAFSLLECRPRTGRTHQIRAHLRALGLPIVGDPTYGDPRRNQEWRREPGLWRQFLHAWRLELDHPVLAGTPLVLESPLPEDLRRTLAWAGLRLPGGGGRGSS